ncbi:hypothetical protein [Streptomyces graminilatus]|uniref:hypothetical protein n=1 Tax=Streptomyces graminilatus TaxID=1464070 RepID=UPI0012FE9BB6|nr:hypothetical protein [Streptomyces graminilatus]
MSTTRRPLGTGPTTSTSTMTTSAPRLLPAERAELADVNEHQDVAERKGRRTLGPGAGHLPDAY